MSDTCPECGQPCRQPRVIEFTCSLCSEKHQSVENKRGLFPFPSTMKTERGSQGFYACCIQCPEPQPLEVLAPTELAKFDAWTKEHSSTCHPEDRYGTRWSIFCVGTAIGAASDAFCHYCRTRHNITDYSLW